MAKENNEETNDKTTLLSQWIETRNKEKHLANSRITIEEKLINLFGFDKPKGSQSFKEGNFKVTFTGALAQSMDFDGYKTVEHSIPAEFRPVKYQPKLDEFGLAWLKDNQPDIYKLVSSFVTTKPLKTGVKVEVV